MFRRLNLILKKTVYMRQIKATIKMTVIAMTGMSLGVSAQWNSNGNNSTTGKVLAKEYNFPLKPYDFSKKPRTQLSSMTIKLFDDYHSRRPGGSSPDNNNYGTLLSLNGYSSHWESNIYFGASTKKMYFRTSTWSGGTAENGVKGDFHEWRTLLDSKSDLKTNGNLKISGNGNHYISNGKLGIGLISPKSELDVNGKVSAKEYNFPLKPYDFSKKPRTQLSSMTIKLFDDYHSRRPGGSSPDNNNYGTLLSLNGYSSHWESNIYFGASTKKMYFRTSTWSGGTAENGVKGDFHEWRTLLDSKSDLKTNGNLKISGNGNHYISNGKLGIGTVSTGNHKLAVEGSIGAREIKVESNGWSDFVFYDNYNLPTLTEVENHIKQKGHLKDIPSAEEVEKNGIYLGEMDAKLLRKIEELTLYTIDQQKEIEELKKQNSRVKYLELLVNKLLKDNN